VADPLEAAEAEMVERVMRAAREKADSAHHRLPQFYLRGFAGENGRLSLLDPATGQSKSTAPRNAFVEKGYYTVRDEDFQRVALAEVLYEDFENRAARVHRNLIGGGSPADLSTKGRSYYAFLLAAQVTRGETFRDFDRDLAEKLGRDVLRLKAAHSTSWWDRFQAEMAKQGEDLPDCSREQFVEFIEREEYTLRHSPEQTMELSLSSLRDLAGIFFEFAWHTVQFDEPCLFSSEEPLSYWRAPNEGFVGRGIGPATSDEIRLPLSPTVALVLTHPRFELPHRAGRGGARAAAWINYWTWAFRSDCTLVLCPDISRHPLPTAELMESLGRPFAAGPIIAG
jgi:hypothetical protein